MKTQIINIKRLLSQDPTQNICTICIQRSQCYNIIIFRMLAGQTDLYTDTQTEKNTCFIFKVDQKVYG